WGDGGDGGGATLSLRAESTTHEFVSLLGEARGGSGGSGVVGGRGADVHLDDAVTGSTSGALRLIQRAYAGNGGSGDSIPGAAGSVHVVGTAASGGSASSHLTQHVDGPSVELFAQAVGGSGGDARRSPAGAAGGRADASATASNLTGRARAQADAVGGRGGAGSVAVPIGTSPLGAPGGDAVALAFAETFEDLADATASASATAGPSVGYTPGYTAGPSGEGAARAIAVAHGDATAEAEATASSRCVLPGCGAASDAASSDAYAEARNAGVSQIRASAQSHDGAARARAVSTGGAYAYASAREVFTNDWTSTASGYDLVGGATAGELVLSQWVQAEYGAATTGLRAENEGGGALRATLRAAGGRGDGTSNDAHVDYFELSSATGADLVGAIWIEAGRYGTPSPSGPLAPGAKGADAVLDSATTSIALDTTGAASLDVRATGGGPGDVGAASGGNARIALRDIATAARSLDVTLLATGGSNSNAAPFTGSGGSATIDVDLAATTARRLVVSGDARGGAGGRTGTDASSSNATSLVRATGLAAKSSTRDRGDERVEARATATGGTANSRPYSAAPHGGDAVARAEAEGFGDAETHASASARGGSGGSVNGEFAAGGRGGDATASAVAIGHGAGSVTADVFIEGGLGGSASGSSRKRPVAGDGGTATLGRVFGSSDGGGDVSVSATVLGGIGGLAMPAPHGKGEAVHLYNAVDGETSGRLSLSQTARSGGSRARSLDSSSVLERTSDTAGLSLTASASTYDAVYIAGDAIARSTATNATGDAAAHAIARGGSSTGPGGGRGGSASATAFGESLGRGSVDVSAEAIGGDATSGTAGDATLGEVRGVSHGGGDVHVTGVLRAGYGVEEGRGRDAHLRNAVSGSTTGSLTHRQVAQGGGARFYGAPSSTVGGDASSWLDYTARERLASISLVAEAYGGTDPFRRGAGGDADADAHAVNATGDAHAKAIAIGGGPGTASRGSAHASATALARGDASARAEVGAHATFDASADAPRAPSATLGRVFAASLRGGDVDATAIVRDASGVVTGRRALENAVDGETTGALTLSQQLFTAGRPVAPGDRAEIASTLARDEHRARSLDLHAVAVAVDPTREFALGSTPEAGIAWNPLGSVDAAGTHASARIHATTTSGSAAARALARGSRAFQAPGT
ncbi:MAG: hypothetical protein KC560_20205, partial [Myxococcales bacterium]|nr:hypothetical protein [Myxococcales bacterium]